MNASSSVAARRAATKFAGVSVARTRPACIRATRSQRAASFMKWVEMKIVTPSIARQIDQQCPELVARRWIDTRGRLVKDQHLRLMHHRDRQRQALAQAQRQLRRPQVGLGGEIESRHQPGNARRGLRGRHMEQPRVQIEVLAHRQLVVEREGLRQ